MVFEGLNSGHDWVKARSSESAETDVQAASAEEIAKAREIVEGDALLADDSWTEEVIADGGVVTVEGTGEEVIVDLTKFLEARRNFLAFERVKSLDGVLAKIASSRPDDRDVVKSLQ
jgi:hypothetical protein